MIPAATLLFKKYLWIHHIHTLFLIYFFPVKNEKKKLVIRGISYGFYLFG